MRFAALLLCGLLQAARAAEVTLQGTTFTIPEGCTLEPAAEPALVAHPRLATLTEEGELLVAEGETQIVRLVDTDADGFFDRRYLFAEVPEGVRQLVWREGALQVGTPHQIFTLREDAGTGEVVREAWLPEAPATEVAGPWPAPLGWVWWSKPAGAAGTVWWQRPRQGKPEAFLPSVPAAPRSLVFAETGLCYVLQAGGVLAQAFYGQQAAGATPLPWPGAELAAHGQPGEPEASLVLYRGPLVARPAVFLRLEPARQRLVQETGEPLWEVKAPGAWRPQATVADADGSLLLFGSGNLYRLRRTAGTMRDARGQEVDWEAASIPDLVVFLTDARPAVRARAQAQLAHSPDYAAMAIRSIIPKWPVPGLRQTLLWTLAPMATQAARSFIRDELENSNPAVRETAARIAGFRRERALLPQLASLLLDENAAVAATAAEALARIGEPTAVAALLELPFQAETPVAEHAVQFALAKLAEPEQLTAALASASPVVCRRAALALASLSAPLPAVLAAKLPGWRQSSEPLLMGAAQWLLEHRSPATAKPAR